MNRRIVTIVVALVPIVVLCVIGSVVRVPFVAEGPGPTFNTLGDVGGTPVVNIQGTPVDQTAGHLNMTTVSIRDGLTIFDALRWWASGDAGLVPRDEVFPPDQSPQQVEQQNAADFQSSESNAETAALRYLHYPFAVFVGSVVPHGPADGHLSAGDQIISIDGHEVHTSDDVQAVMATTKPGQQVTVAYRRAGADATTTIALGEQSVKGASRGMIGIGLQDKPQVPFTIDFNLANVGGPSAGLMFSLAVVDKLTPGELNGGKFVAGTGTIDPDGTVGPIGGIQFKMRAARDAGATVFLVPSDNCTEASQHQPDGLQLVKVDTLGSAVGDLNGINAGKSVPHC